MNAIGAYALPVMAGIIIFAGLVNRVPIFDSFLSGAGDGLKTAVKILPSLIGLITAVEMFQASGALDVLTMALAPVANLIGIKAEVLPLFLIHPISGGGATAMMTNILTQYGVESTVGRIAAVMCGSAETTFYAVAIYYGSVGIKKTRHTIAVALLADYVAAVASGIAVALIFG